MAAGDLFPKVYNPGMENRCEKAELNTLKIGFGTVFVRLEGEDYIPYVVINPGKRNWFTASELSHEDDEMILFSAGTYATEDIHYKLGITLTKDQILEGYKHLYGRVSKRMVVKVEEYSKLPQRIINY